MPKVKKVRYIKKPPEFRPNEGMFHMCFEDGTEYALTPHNFHLVGQTATRVYAEWQAQNRRIGPRKAEND